jgi:acyl-CoA reductase-like NAD-dependent aldehyde dehydrogenase
MHDRAFAVRNPRTGLTDYSFDPHTPADVAAQARRLRDAQKPWAARTLEDRIAIVRAWSQAVVELAPALSEADGQDTGGGQISRIAAQMIRLAVEAAAAAAPGQWQDALRQGQSRAMPSMHFETVLKPYALVGVISPWNAPTMLSMLHTIPPLLAGCAVLLKPSEVTPRFTAPLLESFRKVPELAAVFDVALGAGDIGAAVVEQVDFLSFTGSVANGRKVAEQCGRRLIPCELELGGKDPLVVTATADIEHAVSAAVRGALTSSGQVCFSIERVYVQRAIHDRFVAALTARAAHLQFNAHDPQHGQIGPFISERQAAIVDAQLDDALAQGAVLVTGGKSRSIGGGLYMPPTILTGVTHRMAIMQEETFGPVIPVMAYDTEDEAIALANDTAFGLSAAVIAGDEAEALGIARRIDAGNVSVQDAFLTFAAGQAESDAFGASGIGGKRSGIQRYLRRQALLVNAAAPVCLSRSALAAAG